MINHIPTCCTTFTPESVKFEYGMVAKIKGINDRFQDIEGQKDLLGLKENSGEKSKNYGNNLFGE